jgi:signal transduction histidine kinase
MAAGLAHEIRNPVAGMEVLAGLLRRRLAVRFHERTVADSRTVAEERAVADSRTVADLRTVADEPAGHDESPATQDRAVAGEQAVANGADLAQARALVDDLADQIQRLARTVNASLDFVRPVDLARETLDPVEVVEGALQRARPSTSGREAIERLYVDPLPRLVGDGNLLEVAVANLISNACEAMAGGDGRRVARLVVGLHGRSVERATGPVRVGSAAPLWRDSGCEEPEVVISVSDTGPGIPPELQERIFYPFFTTKQDGSGVGLSNVQKIVTGHGGAVVVESRPGEGATFRIHLPGTLEST